MKCRHCEGTGKVVVSPTYTELKTGFNILMEYWESLPADQKVDIDKRLKEVNC